MDNNIENTTQQTNNTNYCHLASLSCSEFIVYIALVVSALIVLILSFFIIRYVRIRWAILEQNFMKMKDGKLKNASQTDVSNITEAKLSQTMQVSDHSFIQIPSLGDRKSLNTLPKEVISNEKANNIDKSEYECNQVNQIEKNEDLETNKIEICFANVRDFVKQKGFSQFQDESNVETIRHISQLNSPISIAEHEQQLEDFIELEKQVYEK